MDEIPSVNIVKYKAGWLLRMTYPIGNIDPAWDNINKWSISRSSHIEDDYPRRYVVFENEDYNQEFITLFGKYIID